MVNSAAEIIQQDDPTTHMDIDKPPQETETSQKQKSKRLQIICTTPTKEFWVNLLGEQYWHIFVLSWPRQSLWLLCTARKVQPHYWFCDFVSTCFSYYCCKDNYGKFKNWMLVVGTRTPQWPTQRPLLKCLESDAQQLTQISTRPDWELLLPII